MDLSPADFSAVREKCRVYCDHPVLWEGLDHIQRTLTKLNESTEPRISNPVSFDADLAGNVPKRGYVICYTPRSGSTLLAATLSRLTKDRYACLGYPSEIFNPGHMEGRAAHYGCRTLDDYARWSLWEATDASGLFAVKGDLFQLLPFLFTPVFQSLLPNIRFVYLTREDVLLQAISLVIAHHTGRWTSENTEYGDYAGDVEEIAANVAMLTDMMAGWEKVFAFSGIRPLRLTYGDVESDLSGCVHKVARNAGVLMPSNEINVSVGLRKTRNQKNDELRRLVIEKLSLTAQGTV